MKKLAIVLAALLLASVFVGCGAIGEKALLGKWDVKWDYGTETWEFKDDGTFTWKDPWTVNDPSTGNWIYNVPEIKISNFKDSYNGFWTVDFVSANEMKWTIVKYDNPDFKDSTGKTNAQKQVAGESFTLTKVVEDAE